LNTAQIVEEATKWWGFADGVENSWITYYPAELMYLVDMGMQAVREGGTILEIGCFGGKTLLALALVAQQQKAKVIAVDPMVWAEDKAWPHLQQVIQRFDDRLTFYKMRSEEAHQLVPADLVLDYVHIDGDHLDVSTDCRLWMPHLRPGGIVVFHDASTDPRNTIGTKTYDDAMEGTPGYTTLSHRLQECYQLIRRKP
jgi:predicted O-methyltransferase YrrM